MKKCTCKRGCKAKVKGLSKYARGHHPDCHKDYTARAIKIAKTLTGRKISAKTKKRISHTLRHSVKFARGMKRRSKNKVWRLNIILSHLGKPSNWKAADKDAIVAKIQAGRARKASKAHLKAALKAAWKKKTAKEKTAHGKLISKANKGIPKGPMSIEHKKAISKGNRVAYKEGRHVIGGPNRWHTAKYKRKVYRSSYEVALVKWLEKNKIEFEYEAITFDLGRTSYRPDFYLPKFDVFIEVKGYAPKKFWKKICLLHKLCPTVKILILDEVLLRKYGVL